MTTKCFFSFHYKPDNWRVSKVKEMGSIEEQPLLQGNKWEEIKNKGDAAIQKWIEDNMKGRKCLIVLVGEKTAGRRWVTYEIKKAWQSGMGVLAIHVHNLTDKDGNQSRKGSDPFAGLKVDGTPVTGKVYDPPYLLSKNVYAHISENIDGWVATAIKAR